MTEQEILKQVDNFRKERKADYAELKADDEYLSVFISYKQDYKKDNKIGFKYKGNKK